MIDDIVNALQKLKTTEENGNGPLKANFTKSKQDFIKMKVDGEDFKVMTNDRSYEDRLIQ